MKILIACEFSGTVRDAFSANGHDALSCDLLPSDLPGAHYQGNVFDIINDGFDLMIAHPPCTYLCCSGLFRNRTSPERAQKTILALEFVKKLLSADIKKICLENPVGRINTAIRKPDQYVQPYNFGENASKKTGLWLKNLPRLTATQYCEPRMVNNQPRWSNQTDSGQNRLPPSQDRWKLRSKTYQGIAEAMAAQWGA